MATIMVRFSRDGGKTYGTTYYVSAGNLGEYDHRSYLDRLGTGRNWVCEVTVSDPVFWAFLDCYVEMEVGTS